MPTSNSDLSMVVTRQWDLPESFLTADLDAQILDAFATAFHDLLLLANLDDKAWKRRLETFRKHGLLELAIPLEATLGPIELNLPQADGSVKTVVRELDKPISYGFDKRTITIDRDRIEEPTYLEEVASILAYMFVWRLSQAGNTELLFGHSAGKVVLVKNLCSRAFGKFLDDHHRGQSNAPTLAKFLISQSLEDSVDNLDAFRGFDQLTDRLRADFDETNRQLNARLDVKLARMVEEAKRDLGIAVSKPVSEISAGDDHEERSDVKSAPRDDLVEAMVHHRCSCRSQSELVDNNCRRHNLKSKKS